MSTGLRARVVGLSWASLVALVIGTCGELLSHASEAEAARTKLLLVVGASGSPEYASNFLSQATGWQKACSLAGAQVLTIGLEAESGTNDFDVLKRTLDREPKEGPAQLWLVLIGHGTFDGKQARFNLRGPDFSDAELAGWLKPFRRPLVVVNTSSSSGPFLNKLSSTNRVVITATRSGHEQNYTRFGQYFIDALTSPQADIDHDGAVSLLEAFLTASRQTADFYKLQGRILTEHALIDDNGDALGTPADWFVGLRATKRPEKGAAVDGSLAEQFRLIPNSEERSLSPDQIAQRDALERAVVQHRDKKSQMPEDDYYRELETLLLQLAQFYSSNAPSMLTPAN